jgi:hypothetical protein
MKLVAESDLTPSMSRRAGLVFLPARCGLEPKSQSGQRHVDSGVPLRDEMPHANETACLWRIPVKYETVSYPFIFGA